jgi:hypothetical protein
MSNDAFTGQLVLIPLGDLTISGNEIHWHLFSDQTKPPILLFRFENPVGKISGTIWVHGRCLGRTDDSHSRELPGYNFIVVISDCRIVEPPTKQVR